MLDVVSEAYLGDKVGFVTYHYNSTVYQFV